MTNDQIPMTNEPMTNDQLTKDHLTNRGDSNAEISI
jgi:hypothetical protein